MCIRDRYLVAKYFYCDYCLLQGPCLSYLVTLVFRISLCFVWIIFLGISISPLFPRILVDPNSIFNQTKYRELRQRQKTGVVLPWHDSNTTSFMIIAKLSVKEEEWTHPVKYYFRVIALTLHRCAVAFYIIYQGHFWVDYL